MSEEQGENERGDDLPDEDRQLAYGKAAETDEQVIASIERKTAFRPWHHPVKQIVRARQWAALTKRLIDTRAQASRSLRYFTLPGPDLLDVRVLAEVCTPLAVQIEYFGFDVGRDPSDDMQNGLEAFSKGEWINAESALRQAGSIADSALILPDRLEDLAIEKSQAAAQLRLRPTFDVINIDACDHLAYVPKGRTHNTFDALQGLLRHQLTCKTPWLLFVTTRTHPELLGNPGVHFQQAVTQNIGLTADFGHSLAECLGADISKLATALATAWGTHDANFLKLYSIGLGKFLLQFFHMQPNLPANVELASCYAYRVHNSEPDMLALAFRITPEGPKAFPGGVGGAAVVAQLEPERAIRVAKKARKLWDLDHALDTEAELRREAVDGIKALLSAANYDIDAWSAWLDGHERRPMRLE